MPESTIPRIENLTDQTPGTLGTSQQLVLHGCVFPIQIVRLTSLFTFTHQQLWLGNGKIPAKRQTWQVVLLLRMFIPKMIL
jgi:hypothetical protein